MALSMCMHEVWNTCSSVSKVDVSWLSAFKMNTMEISWSVKGYHYFKVKPNPGEVMQVRREFNNPVDPNAMSVLREGGEQVGRVPANLCGAFRQLLEIGYTRKINLYLHGFNWTLSNSLCSPALCAWDSHATNIQAL